MTDYQHRILGWRRVGGGDYQVTVSLAPGTRIQLQVPAQGFDATTLPEIVAHMVGRLHPRNGGDAA